MSGWIHRVLFRPFERWLDPFKAPPADDLPRDVVAFIRYFINQAPGPFIAILIVSGLTGLIETGLYASVGIIVDALGESDPATVWSDYGAVFLAMAFAVLVLRTVAMSLNSLISELTIVPSFFALVRWQLHRRMLRQSYAYFQDDFAGRIATKVMQAGPSIGDFTLNLIQGIWQFAIFGVVSIGLFAALDWRLAAVLIIWFVAYFGALYLTLGEIRRRSQEQSQARASLNGRLVDSYTNVQTVKLFAGRQREDAFVRDGLEHQIEKLTALGRYVAGLRVALVTMAGLLIVVSGGLGIALWQAGEMSIGALTATLGLVLRLNHMSGWISFQINGLYRELGTIQDTIDTVAADINVTDTPGAPALHVRDGALRFDDVHFSYGRDTHAVRGLTLDIAPGERVGLVGRSGAGKSTLAHLLLRLYDVQRGRITIDGIDISDVTQDSLRAQIGVVTQDTALLHRSVADNIGYGRRGATMSEIVAAAQKAAAHDFIVDLADAKGRTGYDAHVGERGVKLSGGQRQRIAIARVFLKDAPILVLDEATSALDSEVEAVIQEKLFDLMERKTVLAIAHRLSTIAMMDRLVVLDGGRIVEVGTHDALIKRGGLYASLWDRQSGSFLYSQVS